MACVELPKDAYGRSIPLDTGTLYKKNGAAVFIYHYDVDKYWDMFRCRELKRAPEWDGHTPDQAIERIGLVAQTLADAREKTGAEIGFCRNVHDEDTLPSRKNGSGHSACGEKVVTRCS